MQWFWIIEFAVFCMYVCVFNNDFLRACVFKNDFLSTCVCLTMIFCVRAYMFTDVLFCVNMCLTYRIPVCLAFLPTLFTSHPLRVFQKYSMGVRVCVLSTKKKTKKTSISKDKVFVHASFACTTYIFFSFFSLIASL